MSCSDCQKRMHLGLDVNSGAATPSSSPDDDMDVGGGGGNKANGPAAGVGGTNSDIGSSASPTDLHDITVSPDIDYSLPITTTYLKHMRSLGYSEEDALNPERAGVSTTHFEHINNSLLPKIFGHPGSNFDRHSFLAD